MVIRNDKKTSPPIQNSGEVFWAMEKLAWRYTMLLHKLSAYFLNWPAWIKMLLLVALTSLTMTAVVLVLNFVVESIR